MNKWDAHWVITDRFNLGIQSQSQSIVVILVVSTLCVPE